MPHLWCDTIPLGDLLIMSLLHQTPLGGPSIAPAPVAPPDVAQPAAAPGAARLPVPPAPALLHDGRVFVAPAGAQATSAGTRATTIGVSVGVGVLLVVGVGELSP